MSETNKKSTNVSLRVPLGTCMYPYIYKIDEGRDYSSNQFSVQVHWGKDVDLSELRAAVVTVAKAKWGDDYREVLKADNTYTPIKDGDEKASTVGFAGTNYVLFKRKPDKGKPTSLKYIGKGKRPIPYDEEYYSGCQISVFCQVYAWEKAGNRGVNCGLEGVIFVRDGERLQGTDVAAAFEDADFDFGDQEIDLSDVDDKDLF